MARNKYPEVTVNRILDTANRLFLEKGYDQTTIQDIVEELGGLSKGAIYHHFKSKEEILDAVTDRMYSKGNPFDLLKEYPGLNGLQKVRQLLVISITNMMGMEMVFRSARSLLKNPWFLAKQIEEILTVNGPTLCKVIDEGIADGSIQTEYPEELAETALLLLNVWLSPSLFSIEEAQFMRKVQFLSDTFRKIGLPAFDEEIEALFLKFYRSLHQSDSQQ